MDKMISEVHSKKLSGEEGERYNRAMKTIHQTWNEGCGPVSGAFLAVIGIKPAGDDPDNLGIAPHIVVNPNFVETQLAEIKAFVYKALSEAFLELATREMIEFLGDTDQIVVEPEPKPESR